MEQIELTRLTSDTFPRWQPALSALLCACVSEGASISFIQPFSQAQAKHWWLTKIAPRLQGERFALLIATVNGELAASVQLDWDTPPNQQHRGEVAKLLTHPNWRRRGLAKKLMLHLEELAIQQQLSLLTLDTRSGDNTEPLYLSMGYQVAGIIPNFAKAPDCDRLDATTVMYKQLSDMRL